jgi:hypothetical protein
LAKEQTPSRSPRWVPLIGVGLVIVLAIGAVVLLTRDDAPGPATGETNASEGPAAPSFRFTETSRDLVRTSRERIGKRHRRAAVAAAATAQEVLTGLYAEGFFDPTNREQGRYIDAFRGFTRGARERAEAGVALFTAGPAGDGLEEITPNFARIATRILLDRQGAPVLLVSSVRFSAIASGSDTVVLRSTGRFLFERVGRTWKVVSFQVIRNDRVREAG